MQNGSGWIKLHRRLLTSDAMFRAGSTFPLFCFLLLLANDKGVVTVGRHQIANWLKMKPSTVYLGLKRLENMTTIRLEPNNKMTVVTILNWDKYQSKPDSKVTTNKQQNDTKQEYRIKNKEIDSNVELLPQVRRLYQLFISEFSKNDSQYKLTDSRKAKLKVRLSDCGEDMVAKAIRGTAAMPFYRGDNDRGWKADLDFIIRSYEQVERLADITEDSQPLSVEEALKAL